MKRPLTVPLLLFLLQSLPLSAAFNFPSWSTISASIPAAFGDTSLSQVQILASRLASKESESALRPFMEETITDHGKLMGTGGTVMVRPTNTQQKQVWTALENLERDS
jgi:hypothetical protein